MNMWGNGTCLEVATNGTERWRAEMESDCCPAGIWLGATPREVYICIFWFLILCWIFLGVAMGADVFMTSIEVITSKESVKQVTGPDGSKKKFHTRVWNATVANLTLMALGSSAPEILLNVMEVLVGGMNSGELGPSTIVGSAAFNLMVITAVCLVCLPEGETRTIKQLGVFLCTAFCAPPPPPPPRSCPPLSAAAPRCRCVAAPRRRCVAAPRRRCVAVPPRRRCTAAPLHRTLPRQPSGIASRARSLGPFSLPQRPPLGEPPN